MMSTCVVTIEAALYSRVKYADDGREMVTPSEFVSLHFTFTLMSAWISYQVAFQFLILASHTTTEFWCTLFVYSMLGAELCINLARFKDICYGIVMLAYLSQTDV
jgi:hypothetical protein